MLEIDSEGRTRPIPLDRTPWRIEKFGLARSRSGELWLLANRGRSLVGFDPRTGKAADAKELGTPFQGIWDRNGEIILARLAPTPGESLLANFNNDSVHPFGSFLPRTVTDIQSAVLLGFIGCGAGRPVGSLSCWWIADGTTITTWGPGGERSQVSAPSLAIAVRPKPALVERALTYPLRDVYPVWPDELWILTNQEGDVPPFDDGAVRSKHLIKIDRSGRPIFQELKTPGRAILFVDSSGVLLLFADGSIGKVGVH